MDRDFFRKSLDWQDYPELGDLPSYRHLLPGPRPTDRPETLTPEARLLREAHHRADLAGTPSDARILSAEREDPRF